MGHWEKIYNKEIKKTEPVNNYDKDWFWFKHQQASEIGETLFDIIKIINKYSESMPNDFKVEFENIKIKHKSNCENNSLKFYIDNFETMNPAVNIKDRDLIISNMDYYKI